MEPIYAHSHTYPSSRYGHTYSGYKSKIKPYDGLGGFPGPLQLISQGFSFLFPQVTRQLHRTTTISHTLTRTQTQMPDGGGGGDGVQYVSFDAIVGRNRVFHMLTVDEMDELGGVEWRALNALL
jgi:hypothetical protein